MKLFPRFCRPRLLVLPVTVLFALALTGCGQHKRSASTLSDKDKTTLAKYETIRVALVSDNLRDAKRAAKDLGTFLKPTPASPATPLDASVTELTNAISLDKARTAFQTLSASVVPLADGVEGYYVVVSPSPEDAEWVQPFPKVDNPYLGRPMRDVGSPRK